VIECVPNVSEGRDSATIARMAHAIQHAGSLLLDTHRDLDHHRSVFTFVGSPPSLAESVLSLAKVAVEAIDVSAHVGVHPRVGAIDVIPFIPLSDASMEECILLAKETGRQLAERYQLPVFLYGRAATRLEHSELPDIRRGGLKDLARRMQTPAWRPAFGPSAPHPTAGAVVVGARPPLVAYNVVLDADDIAIARAIASVIRSSAGGLPGVKALGFRLAGRKRVQVSMNLTDTSRTTIQQVFDAVKAEAGELGVDILESELVGLAPRAALAGATRESLQLTTDPADAILEDRIGSS